MSINDQQILAIFEHDTVTNSLQEPDALAFPPKAGTGYPITTNAAFTGERPIMITDLLVAFGDIVVTDPTADRYLGWAVWSASDYGAAPTFASVVGYTANADLPHIHDNSVSTTAIQAVVNTTYSLFNFVGQGGELIYPSAQPATKERAPIRIPSRRLFQVRVGAYLAGALATIADLSDVTIIVMGHHV